MHGGFAYKAIIWNLSDTREPSQPEKNSELPLWLEMVALMAVFPSVVRARAPGVRTNPKY